MLRKEKEKEKENQLKENVGINQNPQSSKNTLMNQTNADAGGIMKGQTVLVAKMGRIFSSVAFLCTTTALKRIRRIQRVVLVCATMSLHSLLKDFPAILITATKIVPGALRRDTSVRQRTRILELIPREVADVQMARIRTIATVNRVTASTFLPVMSMLNASLRRS